MHIFTVNREIEFEWTRIQMSERESKKKREGEYVADHTGYLSTYSSIYENILYAALCIICEV